MYSRFESVPAGAGAVARRPLRIPLRNAHLHRCRLGGDTATVMVLVWTRSRFSLGGTRCQRWPPASLRLDSSSRVIGPDLALDGNRDRRDDLGQSHDPGGLFHQFVRRRGRGTARDDRDGVPLNLGTQRFDVLLEHHQRPAPTDSTIAVWCPRTASVSSSFTEPLPLSKVTSVLVLVITTSLRN